MTTALIIAAGTGRRMHLETPKQFLRIRGKPILVHTLERFQNHPEIDAILVVTLPDRIDEVKALAEKHGLDKLRWVIAGGATGQESIRNGVEELSRHLAPEDIVLVHDGIRPMVSARIISDDIAICRRHGNAITVLPSADAICRSSDGESSDKLENRDELWRTQTPQAVPLKTLVWAHGQARERGLSNVVATFALLIELGVPVHFVRGSETNVKITTQDDLAIFRALLAVEEHPVAED